MSVYTPSFALSTVRSALGTAPVIEVGGHIWKLREIAPQLVEGSDGLMNLFDDWKSSKTELFELAGNLADGAVGVGEDAGAFEFLTPLQYPRKVICTGTNYYDHVSAAGYPGFSKEASFPAMFLKPPTTTLVGEGQTLKYPEGSTQFDWEVELVIVIGTTASKISAASALDYVAGYMTGLDMSARDFQRNPKHFAKMDLFLGKAFDTSCPVGPKFVPAEFIPDPQDLYLKLWRNGVLEQDSNSCHMIWSIAEQIEIITRTITLEPGDLLLTGTPAGTGLERGEYASVGDVLEAEVEHLGRLRVEIV